MKTNPVSPRPLIRDSGRRRNLGALFLLASLLAASTTTFTRTVGSRSDTSSLNDNDLWSNSLNWSANGVPGAGDTANVGATAYGNPDPAGSTTLHRLQISGGAAVTVTSLTVDELTLNAANLDGGTIAFSGGGSHDEFRDPDARGHEHAVCGQLPVRRHKRGPVPQPVSSRAGVL